MLVIVASRHDPSARALVSRWAPRPAALLSCDDLSHRGWVHRLPQGKDETAVISGELVPTSEIEGVLIRWPAVFERELVRIAEADREYVAAEMNAFLLSWVVSLDCPVLNRPSASSLLGPAWRPEQWVHAAVGLGLPVHPVRRRVGRFRRTGQEPDRVEPSTVTIVGGRWFGDVAPELARRARRLADAGGVDLLAVHFTRPDAAGRLVGADLLPDLSGDGVAEAVADYLGGERSPAPAGESGA